MTPEEEQQLREVLVSGLQRPEAVPEGASLLTIATVVVTMSKKYQRALRRLEDPDDL